MENGEDPHMEPTEPVPLEPRTRRSFLGTLASAAAALVAAVCGFAPKVAEAYDIACCHLCRSPSSSCANVAGTWAWSCCLTANRTRYNCVEYYKTNIDWDRYDITGDCQLVYGCSTYYRIGSC
jgi:hypothetical protein